MLVTVSPKSLLNIILSSPNTNYIYVYIYYKARKSKISNKNKTIRHVNKQMKIKTNKQKHLNICLLQRECLNKVHRY